MIPDRQPLAQSVSLQLLSKSDILHVIPESPCDIIIAESVSPISMQLPFTPIASADGIMALNAKIRTKTRNNIKSVYIYRKGAVKIIKIVAGIHRVDALTNR